MRLKLSAFFPAALLAIGLALLMAAFPAESLRAAVKGVGIWWDVLFPALFPFLVLSEVMLGMGLVHFFGTLLDPLMRPVFRVPGIGGFVMTMGFVSGYPVGARLTSQLWEQRLLNREEGERLVSFTTSSDPIFLIGAVSVGFFHNPALAMLLAAAHYGGAVLVGLVMRFHGCSKRERRDSAAAPERLRHRRGGIIRQALDAMHEARISDGRPLGLMLQEGVGAALRLVLVIGGLVVFFSVVMEVLASANMMQLLYAVLHTALQWFSFPAGLAEAIVNGLFEVTLGVKSAASAGGSLLHQAAIASWVLAWAGLSVHAQAMSLLHHTNLRYGPFLFARALHGLISCTLVFLLWSWLAPPQETLAAWGPLPLPGAADSPAAWLRQTMPYSIAGGAGLLALMLLVSAAICAGRACVRRLAR